MASGMFAFDPKGLSYCPKFVMSVTRHMFGLLRHKGATLRTWEFDMRRIIQANIDRLKVLLKTESDPTKRAMESRLLAEEELKLEQLSPYDKNEIRAY